MTICILDVLFSHLGTSLLFHVQFLLLLLDLHTDFSGGRSGVLIFPSLEEFSIVCFESHSQGFGIVSKAEVDVFPELSCFFDDSVDVGNLISGFVPLLNSGWTSVISWFLCVLNRTLFSSYSLHCFKIVWSIFRTSITVCILITLEFLSDRVLSCTNILSSTPPFFHPDRSWLGMTVPVILLHSTLILDCSD